METYTYKDIKDYLSVVEEYNEGEFRLFRGQSCDGPLLPKIARKNPKQDTTEKEKKMLEELRRRANLFIGNKMDDWDLMVYAQHFGMATRLLDWTSNPLAALWFACCDAKKNTPGYVYLLEVSADLLLDRQSQKNPFSIGKTRVLKPNLNSNRIVAQSGWFTAHRYSKTAKRFIALERNSDIKERLVQIKMEGNNKGERLRVLDVLGVNSQVLFADIEGVCKYINWLHEV